MKNQIRCGSINCDCGRNFYFETVRTKLNCLYCNKEHDVSNYPIKIEHKTEEVEKLDNQEGD